jgi:hypothetical protein
MLPRFDFRVKVEACCYASESELNYEGYFLADEFEIKAKTARVILVFMFQMFRICDYIYMYFIHVLINLNQ